jgi:hypothetical protein
MGVSVKAAPATTSMGPPPMHEHHSMPVDASHFALTASALDKSKKRKR